MAHTAGGGREGSGRREGVLMLTTTSTSTTTMTHCRHRRCPHHLGLHWVCPTWLAVHHLHANKHTRARTHMHTQDAYNIDKAVLTRARTHTQTHTYTHTARHISNPDIFYTIVHRHLPALKRRRVLSLEVTSTATPTYSASLRVR